VSVTPRKREGAILGRLYDLPVGWAICFLRGWLASRRVYVQQERRHVFSVAGFHSKL
jgi:hypothetical protein